MFKRVQHHFDTGSAHGLVTSHRSKKCHLSEKKVNTFLDPPIDSKGLVINDREGGYNKNGKIAGQQLFATPPPFQDRIKLVVPPF